MGWRIGACLLLAAAWGYTQPIVLTVVNGASFEATVAPGSLVAIYGTGLATATLSAPGVPLPVSLGGTSVTIGGVTAGLYYVSATQVNAVVPPVTPTGGVTVTVTSGTSTSAAYNMKVTQCAPAIFTRIGNGLGRATVFDNTYTLVDTVRPGQAVSFYATGLGATALAADGYTRALATPSVYMGESPATVTYAGASGYPGVYQVNIVVPLSLASQRFYLTSTATTPRGNTVTIGIPPGGNARNVSGSVKALYPVEGSHITYSPLLLAAQFTARFDIAPGAAPFSVVAASDTGSATYWIDPLAWTITGRISVPYPSERAGDFSYDLTKFSATDFISGGQPLPGNMVPLSRMDPVMTQALQAIPLPNTGEAPSVPPDSTSGLMIWRPSLPVSGTVVLDGSQDINSFGNFAAIPYTPYRKSRATSFQLYIDGALIDSVTVTYTLP